MATFEVLEKALRGGEQARQLELQCRIQLAEAERAVRQAVQAAPEFIRATREQHETHINDTDSLQTQLDMLGESLDDVMKSSADMLDRTKKEAAKRRALDSLADAIEPFVHIANALNRSDDISSFNFQQLETSLVTLQAAAHTALRSEKLQLKRTIPELEERSDQVKVTMKSLFMSLYEIKSDCIFIKNPSSGSNHIGTASKSLANVDLLKNVIDDLISELLRNEVALGLSRATSCIEEETGDGYVIRWSDGGPGAREAELLEFDLDDIDSATDTDIDAMTENLDIGNAAARALKVYDVLRLKLLGEGFSRDLAFALQSWFCNHVLPSTVVLSSRRLNDAGKQGAVGGNDALHSRVAAVSASARAIQAAIRVRGVPSFVLIVEMDALEAKVGSECRAQAVLRTRQAIASFSAAAHDNDEVTICPISSDSYVPMAQRSIKYFAPCLVTRTGIAVHEAFISTRRDALQAAHGGSKGIAAAMNAAALECLRAYREDVPVQYMEELRSSLRLKALYYTDCTMFCHSCRLAMMDDQDAPEVMNFVEEVKALETAANRAMSSIRRIAERHLDDNLTAACRNGSLGAYEILPRIQRSTALSAAFQAMREVVSVFAEIVPTELAELAAGRLLERYLARLCDEIVKLPEISAEACVQIDGILRDADQNVHTLMELVKGIENVREGEQPPESILRMKQGLKRVHAIREILDSRMEDITTAFRQGKYNGLISRQEIEYFILAIFEESELRTSFLADLDISLDQETSDWNANW